nr:biotin transporter BioY [uncultured Rhodopila sp.]
MTTLLNSYLSAAPARTRWLSGGLAVLGGSAVLALSAQIAVPLLPVPITMQSLAVLMLGSVLGPRLGAAAVLLYLLEGASGLPVFANGSGTLAHLTGPTGGYLVSFVPAAWLAGRLAQRGWMRSVIGAFLSYTAGHAVILAAGCAWLSLFVGVSQALALGVVPFIAGSLVKSALGAALGRALPRLTAARGI